MTISNSISETTLSAGINHNAEMIKAFYTDIIFDKGDISAQSIVAPVSIAKRVTAAKTRTDNNIVFSARINPGDLSETTVIKGVWLSGTTPDGTEIFLVKHVIPDTVVNSVQGLLYEVPYAVTGYSESYEE